MKKVIGAAVLAAGFLSGCTPTNVVGTSVTPGTSTGCAGPANSVCFGEVNRFQWDPATDTIQINNLPFDYDGTYRRLPSYDVPGTGGRPSFKAYINDLNIPGSQPYLAYYSSTPFVQAGVVATGTVVDYSLTGRMLSNSGTVPLPSRGQALYTGTYAGIRVYQGGGIGFSDGQVDALVDFKNFDKTGAIATFITQRHAYDQSHALQGALPDVGVQLIGISGNRYTQNIFENLGGGAQGKTGTLDGIFGGPNGTQIAGVLVMTGPDPFGGTARESGAFIVNQTTYTP